MKKERAREREREKKRKMREEKRKIKEADRGSGIFLARAFLGVSGVMAKRRVLAFSLFFALISPAAVTSRSACERQSRPRVRVRHMGIARNSTKDNRFKTQPIDYGDAVELDRSVLDYLQR